MIDFPCFRHVLAALVLTGGAGSLPAAHAELPDEYRALLVAADETQDDGEFVATANLVAGVAPGGMADVLTTLSEIAPARIALFDAPPADGTEPVVVADTVVTAPDAATAGDAAGAHEETSGVASRSRWGRTVGWVAPDRWDGRIKFGIRLDRGNTELSDYSFALELDREFERGWNLDSKLEYFYTEGETGVTRDNWLVEARGERETVDGWGYYVGGTYEADRLSGLDNTAFATAGGFYHVIDRDAMSWVVRAGTGARYRQPEAGNEATTDWVFEAGSVYEWALTETSDFSSETTLLAGSASRADQRFSLTTEIAGDWGVQVGLRVKHEFEPEPASEATDTRFDVSVVRDF